MTDTQTQIDVGTMAVLILEDEFVIAMDLENQVRDWGCRRVRVANSVAAAERALEVDSPNLMIADFSLCGETSEGLVARLQKSGTRVVLLTGRTIDEATLDRMGRPAVLQKPVSTAQLRQVIEGLPAC